ncbi:MAG: 16S rRNA (guanine(527)-N(7))-methyltransferase RsmG [Spirochaetaceae bacterium]|nr:16S rRNA (guanine(527)-N(7))-methyltransferase RsmG [Spirochaetaceae bacterium]
MDTLLARGLAGFGARDRDVARITGPRAGEIGRLLEAYADEITLFNPALGLVGAKDRRELIVKHILDSLAPLGPVARLLEEAAGSGNAPVADVGSGAGLPGIPLAIALPRARFTLIERMGRRAGFLRNALAVLGIGNAEVEEKDLERAAKGRFSLAVFRAFRPLEPALFRALSGILAPDGALAAWKGRRAVIDAELAALGGALDGFRVEIHSTPVPFLDEERHVVLIRRS